MCDRIMIPFAWDGSRGFFCLDMTPAEEGKKGQVVALDYDYNECTWLADDLEGFFEFVYKMLITGKCYVNKEEEVYFDFESGHFFNVMKDVLVEFFDKDNSDDLEIELDNLDFLKGYKSLKVLEIDKMKIKDLDFLQYLKKLTKFKMEDRAENEEGLVYIKSLPNIKEFEYPVGDMSLYSDCEKLEHIGIDAAHFKNPEELKDSNVSSVMVFNAISEKEAKNVIKQVEEYISLSSYGYTGDFLNK